MPDPTNYVRGMVLDDRVELARAGVPDPIVLPRFGATPEDVQPTGTFESIVGDLVTEWPVRDQWQTQYCTRYALCAAMERRERRALGRHTGYLSPHFMAWADDPAARGQNLGQAIVLSAYAAQRVGVCSEAEFPSETQSQKPEDRVALTPPRDARVEAERHQVLTHYRIEDGDVPTLWEAHRRDMDVVYGLLLRRGFYTGTGADGVVTNDDAAVGWHAMLSMGIVSVAGTLYSLSRNSYGVRFGRQGYVLVPLREMERARDLRVVTSVEIPTRGQV